MPRTRKIALAALVFLVGLYGLNLWPPASWADTPPSQRVSFLDTPVTGAADVLTSSISVSSGTAKSTTLTITAATSDAATLSLVVYGEDSSGAAAGVGQTFTLNGGTATTAGALYSWSLGVSSAYTYNIQSDTTTRMHLIIDEVREGAR